eukprot:gene29418-biopygen5345
MGLYEFNVLPFGLANAPAVFTKVMNDVYRDMIGVFVVVYLDDILIFSSNEADHEDHVRQVLQRLKDNKLYLKREKCRFFQAEVKFLGHVLSGDGVRANEVKIQSVRDWPVPTTSKAVQKFLGLANFFRKFVQGFSSHAAPLTEISNGNLKDASVVGTGGVLFQADRPIAYFSHKLTAAERNYSTGEQELLAIYLALKEWRCYLEGCTAGFDLDTDHEPLIYLRSQPILSRKQARIMEFLSRFGNMKWKHIAGRTNVADPLSRHPTFEALTCLVVQRLHEDDPAHERDLVTDIKAAYEADVRFDNPRNTQFLRKTSAGLWVGTDRSRRYASPGQIVVPNGNSLKARLLHAFHDLDRAGHFGIDRTFEAISRSYWWPAMRLDVTDYVRSCDSCQRTKAARQKAYGSLQPLPIPARKWQSISMDFITGLPKRGPHGFDVILVVVDRLTKMVKLAACHTTDSAERTANVFHEKVLCDFGIPESIVSDRDVRFTSLFWKSMCSLTTTARLMSTAFHPQTDGQTERANQVLEDALRAFTNEKQKDWPSLLPNAQFAINNAFNRSIQDTPFHLMYGQHPRVALQPSDVHNVDTSAKSWLEQMDYAVASARRHLLAAQDRYKSYADRKRRPIILKVGQHVMLSAKNLKYWPGLARKLLPRFVGPYPISHVIEKGGETVAVTLTLPDSWKIHPTFHVSLVKPYFPGDSPPEVRPSPFHTEGCVQVYEIARVVSHKFVARQLQYFVQWLHSDNAFSWESAVSLADFCPLQIKEYWHTDPADKWPSVALPFEAPAASQGDRVNGQDPLRRSARLQGKPGS